MLIEWADVPWAAALAGGALVGLAAGLLVLLTGRIMGMSDMVGRLLGGAEGEAAWSIAFIAGLIIAPTVMQLWGPVVAPVVETGWPLIVAGGLIVGVASRLVMGAVSGNAIAGVARLSPRSILSAICMFIAGAVSSLALRQVIVTGGAA